MNAVALRLALGGLTLAGCLYVTFEETDGFRVLTSARQPAVRALRHPMFEAPLRTSQAQLVSALPAPGSLRVVEITWFAFAPVALCTAWDAGEQEAVGQGLLAASLLLGGAYLTQCWRSEVLRN